MLRCQRAELQHPLQGPTWTVEDHPKRTKVCKYLGMKSEMDVAMNPLAVSLHILGEIGITDFSAEIFKKYYK